jgi:hypothetical protein
MRTGSGLIGAGSGFVGMGSGFIGAGTDSSFVGAGTDSSFVGAGTDSSFVGAGTDSSFVGSGSDLTGAGSLRADGASRRIEAGAGPITEFTARVITAGSAVDDAAANERSPGRIDTAGGDG